MSSKLQSMKQFCVVLYVKYILNGYKKVYRSRFINIVMLGVLFQLLFVPIYLNQVRLKEFDTLSRKVSWLNQFSQTGQEFNDVQKNTLLRRHNIYSLMMTSATGESRQVTFGNKNEQPIDSIYHVGNENIISDLFKTLYLFNADKDSKAMLYITPSYPSGFSVSAVFTQGYISSLLRGQILEAIVISFLVFMVIFYILEICFSRRRRRQKRFAMIGANVGRMTHDMCNILTSLQLCSDTLFDNKKDDNKRLKQRFLISLEQMTNLCSWITQYTNSSVNTPLEKRLIMTCPFVEEVIEMVRLHDPDNMIMFDVNIDSSAQLNCDRILMSRILYNILLNAVQALQNPEHINKRIISIEVKGSSASCEILISDTACGLSSNRVRDLFLPYKGSKKYGGYGLGMAIAEELVCWHGGELQLISTGQEGTQFSIIMPYGIKNTLWEKLGFFKSLGIKEHLPIRL